jgi:hypothetical protein
VGASGGCQVVIRVSDMFVVNVLESVWSRSFGTCLLSFETLVTVNGSAGSHIDMSHFARNAET